MNGPLDGKKIPILPVSIFGIPIKTLEIHEDETKAVYNIQGEEVIYNYEIESK